jgi:hypothetical protein
VPRLPYACACWPSRSPTTTTTTLTRLSPAPSLSRCPHQYTYLPPLTELPTSRTPAMASAHHDDELVPEQTEGFKVGEKKTLDEYHQLGPRRIVFTSTSASASHH